MIFNLQHFLSLQSSEKLEYLTNFSEITIPNTEKDTYKLANVIFKDCKDEQTILIYANKNFKYYNTNFLVHLCDFCNNESIILKVINLYIEKGWFTFDYYNLIHHIFKINQNENVINFIIELYDNLKIPINEIYSGKDLLSYSAKYSPTDKFIKVLKLYKDRKFKISIENDIFEIYANRYLKLTIGMVNLFIELNIDFIDNKKILGKICRSNNWEIVKYI